MKFFEVDSPGFAKSDLLSNWKFDLNNLVVWLFMSLESNFHFVESWSLDSNSLLEVFLELGCFLTSSSMSLLLLFSSIFLFEVLLD